MKLEARLCPVGSADFSTRQVPHQLTPTAYLGMGLQLRFATGLVRRYWEADGWVMAEIELPDDLTPKYIAERVSI
jgi:hypothetical protein